MSKNSDTIFGGMQDLKQFLPNDEVRIQRNTSRKINTIELLSQPQAFWDEKVAVSGALFIGYTSPYHNIGHTDVAGFWGCAIDLDAKTKADGGYLSKDEVDQIVAAIPEELADYAYVVWSNGVTVWFKFNMYQEIAVWPKIAHAMRDLGKALEKTGLCDWDDTYFRKNGDVGDQANHCYRLAGSYAKGRNKYSEFVKIGKPVEAKVLFKNVQSATISIGKGVFHTSTCNRKGGGGVSKRSRVVGSSQSRADFVSAVSDLKGGLTIPEIAIKYPTLTERCLAKLQSNVRRGGTGWGQELPVLPIDRVWCRSLTRTQHGLQRTYSAIGHLGWLHYYGRSLNLTAEETYDFLQEAEGLKALRRVVNEYWTKEHFMVDFERCKLAFGSQPPVQISPRVWATCSRVWKKGMSVRKLATAACISVTHAHRAIQALDIKPEMVTKQVEVTVRERFTFEDETTKTTCQPVRILESFGGFREQKPQIIPKPLTFGTSRDIVVDTT